MNQQQPEQEVYIALGANLGDPLRQLSEATVQLVDHVTLLQRSPVYRSRAFACDPQPPFYNMAIQGRTTLSATELLHCMLKVEERMGRKRDGHNQPRLIDLDLIFYGTQISDRPELTLPHPRAHQRDFVLKPLLDLRCSIIHPRFNKSVAQLYSELSETTIVERLPSYDG